MNDAWWLEVQREPTQPCTNQCGVNSRTGYCGGCLRTLREISEWSGYSKDEKLDVIDKIEERRKKLNEGTSGERSPSGVLPD